MKFDLYMRGVGEPQFRPPPLAPLVSVPVCGRKPISPNLIQHAIDVKLVGGETQFRLTQPVFELELVGEGETRFA